MSENQIISQIEPFIMKEYPHELLQALVEGTSLDIPPKITSDIHAGMQYALSTLAKDQQEILRLRYVCKLTVLASAAQLSLPEEEARCLEKKAIDALRFPAKWSYVRHGIAGYMRKRIALEHRQAYRNGFCDGYRAGINDAQQENIGPNITDAVLDQPIETLNLSPRAMNSLKHAKLFRVCQVANLSEQQILMMRNIGTVLAGEIASALQELGILHTAWDKFVL